MAVGVDSFNLDFLSGINLGSVWILAGIVAFALFFVIIVGGLLILWLMNKKYYIKIPLYKNIGNVPTRVATYKAKNFPIGKAGDKLWFVRGANKYLAPATLQSANNEFMHWEREDGEWINFVMGDLDKDQKQAGIKYIHQDMRSQRIATANLLEQRLMAKGFWEKWGVVIGYVVFFLVISVAVVMDMYMFGKVLTQLSGILEKTKELLNVANAIQNPANSIIPAIALFMIKGRIK